MFYNHSVAVVIPAYNVEPWIGKVITNLPDYIDHIIVVDDASPDNLAKAVEDLNHPKVTLLRHENNQGVGGAMKTGYKEALDLEVDIIVKMDGDNQMDPAYLPALLHPLVKDECDFIKGNRFGLLSDVSNMPFIRRVGNLTLSLATKLVSGYWHVIDSQNGYLAVKAKILRKLRLEKLDSSYFFENSMLINMNVVEARTSDVYIPARYLDEISSLSIGKVLLRFPFKLFRGLIYRIFQRYLYRDFSPVFLMLILGILLFGGGGIWGCVAWYNSVAHGMDVSIGTFALGLIPIILGFQLLVNAIVLDIQQSPTGTHKSYDFSEKEIAEIGEKASADQNELPI